MRPRRGLGVLVVLLLLLGGVPGALAQTPTPTPTPTPTQSPTPHPSPTPTPQPSPRPRHHDNDGEDESFFHPEGAFNTDRLVALAIELRGLGWSERRIIGEVYP